MIISIDLVDPSMKIKLDDKNFRNDVHKPYNGWRDLALWVFAEHNNHFFQGTEI